jgi:hypothetical protein
MHTAAFPKDIKMKNLKISKCELILQQYSTEMFSATVKIGKVRYKFFSRQKETAEKVYGVLLSNCFFNENLIDTLFSIYRLKIERKCNTNYFVSR